MPTYNRAASLRAALADVLAQDYPHIEIVVSDNHSPDATEQVVKEFSSTGEREVRFYRQPTPVPVPENFRTPLRMARGEYFMWAADDDFRAPDFVSCAVRVLRDQHNLALVAHEAQYRAEDGSLFPFFAEGRAWYDVHSSDETVARVRRVLRHSYGNLIYGVYRTAALVAGERTVLDAWRSLNEIPVFVAVAGAGHIRVLPQPRLYKTAPVTVFLAAAKEMGVRPAGAPSAPERSRHWRNRLGTAKNILHYHLDAAVDTQRAITALDLPAAGRAELATLAATTLLRHGTRAAAAALR